jgi:large subunit ribosomal protein L5e
VIAQIVSATIHGDRVFCQADSTEFRKWGLTTGLANYPSAYATGLLLSRRLLQKVKLDTLYEENTKKGTPYDVSKN